MHVDLYEKIWMYAAGGIIAVFLASMGYTTLERSMLPPSHIETIDPATVRADEEFGSPGVTLHEDGTATVVIQAFMFAFLPLEIRVPRGRDITFRMTSPDVIHGFQIVRTNGNTMVVPGYGEPVHDPLRPGRRIPDRLQRVLRGRPSPDVGDAHRRGHAGSGVGGRNGGDGHRAGGTGIGRRSGRRHGGIGHWLDRRDQAISRRDVQIGRRYRG